MSDPINPDHYRVAGCRECIEIIEELGWDQNFYLANAFKYLYRHGRKGDQREDLQKAIWFIQRYLDHAPELQYHKVEYVDLEGRTIEVHDQNLPDSVPTPSFNAPNDL
jgi:hypothetical protein